MEDLEQYLEEIVVPTVKDFEEHPTSVRHWWRFVSSRRRAPSRTSRR